ncbi:MAG: class I adenylate-forming enzyme family protein [Ottowia sp.]|uniref:class I adenylate-forming enzyme family protein n=1 Tax=Ottowia sp. TaxID=1898956 RepID=UPI003C7609C0
MGKILTLHSPREARSYYLNGTWSPETMYALARKHAVERGDAFAVRDPHQRLSWSDLIARVECVADALHEAGLRSGDRVCVWLPNRIETVVVFLACSRNGYVCNPSLHESYTVEEIAGLMSRVECRAAFVQPGYGADGHQHDIVTRLSHLESIQALFITQAPGQEGAPPLGACAFPRGASSASAPLPSSDPDQIVYLAFTSGTTGQPKGVMHSDNTLLANGRALAKDWSLDERSVILSLSPMSHHIAVVGLEQSLTAGCELVLTDRRSGISPIDWIEQTGATYVMGVPTHAMDLLAAMDARGRPGLGRVSVFYMAGAPIPRDLATRFLRLGITPQNVYGMTESGSHQYTRPTDDAEIITGTCGIACGGYEVRLWNQDAPDEQVGIGEIGEIGGRGAVLMLGYFSDQASTEHSFNSSGWFLSGDLGRLDEHGNLEVVGRKKDLINRGGHKIHPARIEELARRHPHVAAAAALGLPDDRLGEKVCLVIVAQGRTPTTTHLLQHLEKQGLSRFEMPEYVAVADEFPLTPSGKILKRGLLEWVHTGKLVPRSVSEVASPPTQE